MIKFEEHDGKLFRMLEKPVPCQSQLKWNYIAGIVNDKPLLIRDIPKIVNPRISITTLNDLSKVEYVVQYYMPLEIIGTFVEEGSADWALYQMMKGDKVTKGHLEHTYWHYDARPHLQCISEYICGTLQIMVSPEIWIKTADKDGWQIYKEPEQIQEPESMGLAKQICELDHNLPKGLISCEAIGLAGFCKECFAKNDGCWKEQEDMKEEPESEQPKPESQRKGYGIKDLKPDNLYLNIKPSTPADWCFDKKNLLVLVDDNFKGIVGENVTREQVGEIAKLLTEPKPESENIIHGHIPPDMRLKYIHLYEFKVGDWVEHKKSKEQGRITYISSDNYDAIEVKLYDQDEIETYTKSDFNADFRKLSPSEVIVKIGCLSGTIEKAYGEEHGTFVLRAEVKQNIGRDAKRCVLWLDALDAPTREFVESLLKAQDEEK